MRQALPVESLNAGLEGAFWCHPDVATGTAAALRPEQRDEHLERFRQNPSSAQRELACLRRRHHAHLSPALHWEELLSYGSHAHPAALDTEMATEIAKAERRLQQLAATLNTVEIRNPLPAGEGRVRAKALSVSMNVSQATGAQALTPTPLPEGEGLNSTPLTATLAQTGRGDGVWQDVARAIEARADAGMVERYGHLLMPLVAERVRREQQAGIKPEVPEWVDPAELSARLGAGATPVEAWLVRDAERGAILLQARPPGPRQSSMGLPLWLDSGGFRLIERGGSGRWLAPASLPMELASLQGDVELTLETARETLRIAPVRRPFGTTGWSCGPGGVSVEATRQGKTTLVVWEDAELQVRQRPQPASGDVPAWTLAGSGTRMNSDASGLGGTIRWGLDEFGVLADLTLVTEHGASTQRFRYIEPGSFLMGSPEAETRGLARKEEEKPWFEREHPGHPVTLTRGYWLADTPCTQAFWQAVTGANPSRFTSPDRPVEQVSWDDVQEFLRQLTSWAPGLPADLPTEAEWEYACRAGTDTAVYTGAIEILGSNNAPALDPIAWYAGNSGVGFELDNGYDSTGWPEKQYPDSPSGTHPAGRKQPNAWGLHDMLGNVWEWCGDGFRDYKAELVEDPVGAVTEERPHRAVRGGSWDYDARGVRSACRIRYGPGYAGNYLGFRLCLRSIEPDQVQAGGTPDDAPGGRTGGSSPLEEAKTAAAERPARWYERFLPGRKRKD
jgi:formylglycine-generating enzyme required for sulfatase activity